MSEGTEVKSVSEDWQSLKNIMQTSAEEILE